MDHEAIDGAMGGASYGSIEGAIDVASNRWGINRRSYEWCKRWIRESLME